MPALPSAKIDNAIGLTRPENKLRKLGRPFTKRYKVDQANVKPAPFATSPSNIIQLPNALAAPNKRHVLRVGLTSAADLEK